MTTELPLPPRASVSVIAVILTGVLLPKWQMVLSDHFYGVFEEFSCMEEIDAMKVAWWAIGARSPANRNTPRHGSEIFIAGH